MPKPKTNRAGDQYTPKGYDACQTPPQAVDPLLPYLPKDKIIWESAAGEGLLVVKFIHEEYNVVGTDILTGENFFEQEPTEWDIQVTNPPYSIKYPWLARAYEFGKPFALLLPVEVLGAKRAQKLFREYGVEVMLLDHRVNFKMPIKGWERSAAQFPVAWFCWQLLPERLIFAEW